MSDLATDRLENAYRACAHKCSTGVGHGVYNFWEANNAPIVKTDLFYFLKLAFLQKLADVIKAKLARIRCMYISSRYATFS